MQLNFDIDFKSLTTGSGDEECLTVTGRRQLKPFFDKLDIDGDTIATGRATHEAIVNVFKLIDQLVEEHFPEENNPVFIDDGQPITDDMLMSAYFLRDGAYSRSIRDAYKARQKNRAP